MHGMWRRPLGWGLTVVLAAGCGEEPSEPPAPRPEFELAETIGEILLARDQRLVAIERHIRAREREIEHIQKDIDERRQRLIDLIKPLKGGPAFRSEPELQMRFLLAGL